MSGRGKGGKGLGKGKRRVSCQGPSGHEGVVTGKDGQDDTEREGNVRKGKDGKHHVKVRPKVSSTIKEQVKTSKVPKAPPMSTNRRRRMTPNDVERRRMTPSDVE